MSDQHYTDNSNTILSITPITCICVFIISYLLFCCWLLSVRVRYSCIHDPDTITATATSNSCILAHAQPMMFEKGDSLLHYHAHNSIDWNILVFIIDVFGNNHNFIIPLELCFSLHKPLFQYQYYFIRTNISQLIFYPFVYAKYKLIALPQHIANGINATWEKCNHSSNGLIYNGININDSYRNSIIVVSYHAIC